MFSFGLAELLILFGIVLLIFGWGRLSQLSHHVRSAVRNVSLMARGDGEREITPTAPDETARKEPHHGG
jgi:Sec-independent protein translocase protein TatA